MTCSKHSSYQEGILNFSQVLLTSKVKVKNMPINVKLDHTWFTSHMQTIEDNSAKYFDFSKICTESILQCTATPEPLSLGSWILWFQYAPSAPCSHRLSRKFDKCSHILQLTQGPQISQFRLNFFFPPRFEECKIGQEVGIFKNCKLKSFLDVWID